MATVKIGGEECELYNDEIFARIRADQSVTAADVDETQFAFSELAKGGGKGGSLMQFTKSCKLLIKQLSGDDHNSLMDVAENYCQRVLDKTHPTLLCRFFFHFRREADGGNYVVMNSLLPNAAVDELYDLKGCADDKIVRKDGRSVSQIHKRWFMVHWLIAECSFGCCVPPNRVEYKNGKIAARNAVFRLPSDECSKVLKASSLDVDFLREGGLMDYSLLVGIINRPCEDGSIPDFPSGGAPGQPLVVVEDGVAKAYYIGIIDFLQGWTGGKKVAHVIKYLFAPKPISTISPGPYAEQFIAANEHRFQTLPPQPTAKRAQHASSRDVVDEEEEEESGEWAGDERPQKGGGGSGRAAAKEERVDGKKKGRGDGTEMEHYNV